MKTIVLYCPLCRGGTDHEVRQYSYGGREAACVICDRRVPLLDDDKPTVDDKPSHEDLEDRLAAAQERLAEMREALEVADRFIIRHKPEHGGAAVVARIRKLLSAAPAGQVLFRGEAILRHQKAGMERDIGWLNLGKHGEITIPGDKSSDGRTVVVTVYDPMPEAEQGGPDGIRT